jgi:sarcosine oxidase subunit alpha
MEMVRQTEVPDWEVLSTVVTTQWSNATICGPKARDLLQALQPDFETSREAFPFMSFKEGKLGGIPVRVVRVSFTGELSFEINVAPRYMEALWLRIMETGAEFGIVPVGSEANHVLRVEKGFLSLGHEVDGTVDPFDLGMGWILSKKKPDYWGKRSIDLRRSAGGKRRELIGFRPEDPTRQVPEGAPLTPQGGRQPGEGLVTACVWSVIHERWIGLALLENGRSRIGETAHVRVKGEVTPVEITKPCFYDPDGERLRS